MRQLVKQRDKSYKRFKSNEFDIAGVYQPVIKPTIIRLENNEYFISACLNCDKPNCMFFDEEEFNPNFYDILPDFPYNPIDEVCPLQCIEIDENSTFPKINKNNCISCGLCVRRCPVGSIYIDQERENQSATISKKHSKIYATVKNSGSRIGYREIKDKKINIFKLSNVDRIFLVKLINNIEKVKKRPLFEGLIIRNLLIELGVPCNITPKGDVNFRPDIYFEKDGLIGIGEVNFGKISLNTPRRLLSDFAILNSRYDIEKNNILPVIFLSRMPNGRSDFYEVLKNVKETLRINIHVIPLLALLILNWHENKLKLDDLNNSFMLKNGRLDVIESLKNIIDDFDERMFKNTNLLEPKK